jgi:hypothetical protein
VTWSTPRLAGAPKEHHDSILRLTGSWPSDGAEIASRIGAPPLPSWRSRMPAGSGLQGFPRAVDTECPRSGVWRCSDEGFGDVRYWMVPDETTHARAALETPLVAAIIGRPTWADRWREVADGDRTTSARSVRLSTRGGRSRCRIPICLKSSAGWRGSVVSEHSRSAVPRRLATLAAAGLWVADVAATACDFSAGYVRCGQVLRLGC